MLWPRFLWLRGLGVIFFSAFFSLAAQIQGLIGPRGILPASDLFQGVGRTPTLTALWQLPSLLWVSSSSAALTVLVWAGLVASVLLTIGVWPRGTCAICTVLFLSFVAAAQDFSSYQSDGMLLEAGFLSVFFAPRGVRPRLGVLDPPSRLARFLLVWEWFRIYLESGIVKLASGDEQWRTLRALDHYYENGPLPTYLGWYAQQIPPHAFHAACVVVVFVFELAIVWLGLGPRRARLVCFFLVTPFQAAIILTANYAFLNYIVLFLGVLLLDDRFLVRAGLGAPPEVPPRARNKAFVLVERVALFAVLVVTIVEAPLVSSALPRQLLWPAIALQPFRIANSYGLFAVMTNERLEIEFQGSRDGQTWTPYPFRFKPQDPAAAPGIYAPYQPRFEWNLWFASLGTFREYPWVVQTEALLLDGEPSVLRLFKSDPFHGTPPSRVRAMLWRYWFTTPAEKRKTGRWWNRELRGSYAPALHKGADGRLEIVPG
ncbi:MAG: lipase maturation factor family protein [Myxococcales bacterium]